MQLIYKRSLLNCFVFLFFYYLTYKVQNSFPIKSFIVLLLRFILKNYRVTFFFLLL